jgi:hypothetical protein
LSSVPAGDYTFEVMDVDNYRIDQVMATLNQRSEGSDLDPESPIRRPDSPRLEPGSPTPGQAAGVLRAAVGPEPPAVRRENRWTLSPNFAPVQKSGKKLPAGQGFALESSGAAV